MIVYNYLSFIYLYNYNMHSKFYSINITFIKNFLFSNWKVMSKQSSKRSAITLKYTVISMFQNHSDVYWQCRCLLQLFYRLFRQFLDDREKGQKRSAILLNILVFLRSRIFSVLLDYLETFVTYTFGFPWLITLKNNRETKSLKKILTFEINSASRDCGRF